MPMVTFVTEYSVEMGDDRPEAAATLELYLPTNGNGGIRDEFIDQEMVVFNEQLWSSWGIFRSTVPVCRARKMTFRAPSWGELQVQLDEMKERMIGHLETVVAYNALSATKPQNSTVVVGIGEKPGIVEDLTMTVQEEKERHFVMSEFGLDALPCSDATGWVMENLNAIKGPYQATWDKMGVYERFKIAKKYLKDCGPGGDWDAWYEWAEDHGPLPF